MAVLLVKQLLIPCLLFKSINKTFEWFSKNAEATKTPELDSFLRYNEMYVVHFFDASPYTR